MVLLDQEKGLYCWKTVTHFALPLQLPCNAAAQEGQQGKKGRNRHNTQTCKPAAADPAQAAVSDTT
jgi:hypothetical protein